MPSTNSEYEPGRLARDSEQFWKVRRLPPANGIFGPPDGPVLHQFAGGIVAAEEAGTAAYRAVAADVDARYFMLVGRRCDGTLRWTPSGDTPNELPEGKLLHKLAIWTGGTGANPWDAEDRHGKVERLVGRLAHRGVVVSRDLPMRFCPTCVAPRSPERIIYQEEEGDAYLVRFEVPLGDRTVNALVWVDAPWRLLGTSAVLLHPEAPYVIARYRRKEEEEVVLTSRSSLERFREWIPGATFEVLEERPGREFAGRPYVYPLRHEFPLGGALTPPGGTILAVSDVTGTGTGIVPLVPGHLSTDALIAEAHGVPGWPLVTPRGQLDVTIVHKYAGLDLKTASEFVVRDLAEGESIFADLRVRRGVPHCMVCGSALIWFPGRAWCLEPGRLPPEAIDLYRRLLPGAPPLHRVEVAPWPISETSSSTEPSAVALLECGQCERLDALDGAASCRCGGKMFAVRRRLVPSAADAFAAWARHDPFPSGDSVRLYLSERRRVPALIHHLTGLTAVDGIAAGVGASVLPTLPEVDLGRLVESEGTDAVRAALVRTGAREGTAATFLERCGQEHRRLERLWSVAHDLFARADAQMLAAFLEPISGHLGELETEDRAFLARWERTRVAAIADYDRGSSAAVHRRIFRFLETDLVEYRRWIRHRLAAPGGPASKRSALRTLTYVLRSAVVLLGPILPYTADAIFRRFMGDRRSLFETGIGPVERPLLDERLIAVWDRWGSFLRAVDEFRRAHAVEPTVTLPRVSIVLPTDEEGDRLREHRTVLERLGRISKLEIASPREPWEGRQRRVRPIESEIQRVYPTQASQIAHLLRRLPSRRSSESSGSAELSVVIQGLPRRLLPSMVGYVETLPEGMVPSPWGLGELYVQIPGSGRAQRPVPPPLSPDAFWLVRHIERRLQRSGGARERAGLRIVISSSDPLASELRSVAGPLARYLEISEVRVPETIAEPPPRYRTRGRTKTGARWWVDFPGLPPPTRRRKARVVRPQSRRVPSRRPRPSDAETEVDYADEKVIAEEEAVRTLNRELDSVLHHAALGPAKVRGAWERGFHDLDRYRSASFDELFELPGFGRGIAEGLVLAFGGTPPNVPRGAPRSPPAHRPDRIRPSSEARPRVGTPSVSAAAPLSEEARMTVGPTLAPLPSPRETLPPSPERPALPPAEPRPEATPSIPLPGATPPAGPPIPVAPTPAETALPIGESPQEAPTPAVPSEVAEAPVDGALDGASPPAAPEPATAPPEGLAADVEAVPLVEETPREEPLGSPPAPAEEVYPSPIPSGASAAAPAAELEPPSDATGAEMPPPSEPGPIEEGIVLGPIPDSETTGIELPPPAPVTEIPSPSPGTGEPEVGDREEAAQEERVAEPQGTSSSSEGTVPTPPADLEAAEPPSQTPAATAAAFEVPGSAATVEVTPKPSEPVGSEPSGTPEVEASVTLRDEPGRSDSAPAPELTPAHERADVIEEGAPVPVEAPESPAPPELRSTEGPSPERGGEQVEGAGAPSGARIPLEEPAPLGEPASDAISAVATQGEPSEGEVGIPGPPSEPIGEAPSAPPAPEALPPSETSVTVDADPSAEPPPPSEEVLSSAAVPPPVPPEEPLEAVAPVPPEPEVASGSPEIELPSPPTASTPETELTLGEVTEPTGELLAPSEAAAPTDVELPPPAPIVEAPPPEPEAPRGGIELMVGASVVVSLQPFLEATAAGLKGVCVVRESPERLRAQAGSRPVEIYWLTNLGRGPTVRPNDLAGFAAFLAHAIDEEHAQLFFIEGVEYLTHIHGVEAVVARLAEFDRLAREREVRVWLHVTPGLLRPGELDRIAAAFPPAA